MLNWNAIDIVLLDMDGTLLDLYFDNYFWREHLVKRYAEHQGLSEVQAANVLYPAFKSVEGTQNWYCLDYWKNTLHLDILALKREIRHLIGVHPHAEAFLQRLQPHKQLVLVTNAHPDSLDLKLQHTGIGRYFHRIISAHRYGQPKEALEFWDMLKDELGFDPARSLLVEDNLRILRTARSFGIAHLLAITRPDSRAASQAAEEFPGVEDFKTLFADMPQ